MKNALIILGLILAVLLAGALDRPEAPKKVDKVSSQRAEFQSTLNGATPETELKLQWAMR